ncbi:unnamed protein product [Toxocara canis]|uniref:Protein sleepless n=1 Tax=Toxocara canis TaxID=6265 RepID=A0A183V777_TOXCA|nr:unnamed protein product [Toxocara canis]
MRRGNGGVDSLLSFLLIISLFESCCCFRCYQYTVRNKVSPGIGDLKRPVICEGLTNASCVKVITKNSMKGLAEETEKAFTTEGRCALYDDECPKSKSNKCFDEPSRNMFGIIQKVRKCCSTKELSNGVESLISSTTLPILFVFCSVIVLLKNN